jgi:hypothetical protein
MLWTSENRLSLVSLPLQQRLHDRPPSDANQTLRSDVTALSSTSFDATHTILAAYVSQAPFMPSRPPSNKQSGISVFNRNALPDARKPEGPRGVPTWRDGVPRWVMHQDVRLDEAGMMVKHAADDQKQTGAARETDREGISRVLLL